MAKPPHVVQVAKYESAAFGGSATDNLIQGPQEIEPEEDALATAGLYGAETGKNGTDKIVALYREGDQWYFEDTNHAGAARQALSDIDLGTEQHKALRQLIHFIDYGPAEGFASGAFRQTTGTVFPTAEVWYVNGATPPAGKIVEKLITWTGINPTTIQWKMYDTDGSTVLVTVTDTITYSGVFETSRTRAIA